MIFSAGPHRCMGSHLARKEMWIAIEEWMSRAPEFAPDPDRKAIAQAGGVWGMYTLPLVWKR
jgi:cytochrome P450